MHTLFSVRHGNYKSPSRLQAIRCRTYGIEKMLQHIFSKDRLQRAVQTPGKNIFALRASSLHHQPLPQQIHVTHREALACPKPRSVAVGLDLLFLLDQAKRKIKTLDAINLKCEAFANTLKSE